MIAIPRVAASAAQRRKVARLCCLVCGREPVDPAHAVPRRLGGCNSPDCVVPLCRAHHRSFDTSGLAVVPYLGPWAILARGRLEESASGFEGSCQEWLEALIAYTPQTAECRQELVHGAEENGSATALIGIWSACRGRV